MTKLNPSLNDYVMKRIEEIIHTILLNHIVYRELSDELSYTLRELIERVPENCKPLLYEYEEREHEQTVIALEAMYKQGFMDGVFLNKEILKGN
ncbi:hypothetical protein AV654_11145 [Paenibacillus elgii]|uniref:Uncharacterized protein n=1 Tax=Paenibacillus elgii TaxID=189691 RepID=A0A163Z376_9BACL|nr:hypothetical protein [Paenibacillus elgii]KZE80897.1 hypothetical protein AV654_11145 [Paenibacillus elgii]